jgi:hypothetical protein
VAARDATGFADRRTAVPQHTRVWVFPIDRKRFIYLDILACFYAPATKKALVRIITIKRIRIVDFVRLGPKRNLLVFDGQQFGCVVNSAVAVIVVANGAVEKVVTQHTVKRFSSRIIRRHGIRDDAHSRCNRGSTCPDKTAVNFNHACIARLDWAKLRVVTHLGNLVARAIDDIDETLISSGFLDDSINCYTEHP